MIARLRSSKFQSAAIIRSCRLVCSRCPARPVPARVQGMSSIHLVTRGIVDDQARSATERASFNPLLLVSQLGETPGEPPVAELRHSLDQGGACGGAGPASAPGSALGGPPGARRATPRDSPDLH